MRLGNKKSHNGFLWKYSNNIEKQIPKKPRNEKHTVAVSSTAVKLVDWYKCGVCNSDINRQFVCCPFCENKIDWSVEE